MNMRLLFETFVFIIHCTPTVYADDNTLTFAHEDNNNEMHRRTHFTGLI